MISTSWRTLTWWSVSTMRRTGKSFSFRTKHPTAGPSVGFAGSASLTTAGAFPSALGKSKYMYTARELIIVANQFAFDAWHCEQGDCICQLLISILLSYDFVHILYSQTRWIEPPTTKNLRQRAKRLKGDSEEIPDSELEVNLAFRSCCCRCRCRCLFGCFGCSFESHKSDLWSSQHLLTDVVCVSCNRRMATGDSSFSRSCKTQHSFVSSMSTASSLQQAQLKAQRQDSLCRYVFEVPRHLCGLHQ